MASGHVDEGTPVSGGKITIGIGGETDGWNPATNQWAIEGNIVADFPLCNKSFNCSYSGADL